MNQFPGTLTAKELFQQLLDDSVELVGFLETKRGVKLVIIGRPTQDMQDGSSRAIAISRKSIASKFYYDATTDSIRQVDTDERLESFATYEITWPCREIQKGENPLCMQNHLGIPQITKKSSIFA